MPADKVWKKIFEQNFHKSLDHRSFYFKQQDKKNLSSKEMVKEIKEAADKVANSPSYLQTVSVAAPFSSRLHPNLVLDFSVAPIHEDVWRVVRAALRHQAGSQSTAVRSLTWWRDFWEPFFTHVSEIPKTRPDATCPTPDAVAPAIANLTLTTSGRASATVPDRSRPRALVLGATTDRCPTPKTPRQCPPRDHPTSWCAARQPPAPSVAPLPASSSQNRRPVEAETEDDEACTGAHDEEDAAEKAKAEEAAAAMAVGVPEGVAGAQAEGQQAGEQAAGAVGDGTSTHAQDDDEDSEGPAAGGEGGGESEVRGGAEGDETRVGSGVDRSGDGVEHSGVEWGGASWDGEDMDVQRKRPPCGVTSMMMAQEPR